MFTHMINGVQRYRVCVCESYGYDIVFEWEIYVYVPVR